MSVPRRRLRPFGRLDRYVAGIFVSSYATALLLVVGLFWILDLASHIDAFFEPWEDGTKIATHVVARYELFNLPYLFLQVAPFVTLFAGMFTVNRLLRYREVVAVLGAGVSAHRLLAMLFLGGALAAAGMFGTREWVAHAVAGPRDALLDVLENQRLEREYSNLWLRDLDGNNVRLGVFHPGRAGQRNAWAEDFEAIMRHAEGVANVRADEAHWEGGQWRLVNGTRLEVGDRRSVEPVQVFEGFAFTPELALTFRRARDNPLELSFGEVQELLTRDPDNIVYQTLWQYHLTFPLANLVLLLVGIPTMLGYERGRGSERMAVGVGLALFYFAADFVFRSMGLEGGVTPVLASWVPILFFGSLGVVMFDSMRT